MKHKKIFKYILSIGFVITFNKYVSFAVNNNIIDKSIVKEFNNINNGMFNSVIETSDNGTVAIGKVNPENNTNSIILKYDSKGNELWIRNFGKSNHNDSFESVIETSDGGIVAVGYSNSTDAGFTSKGVYDAIMVKYDKNGNQEWIKNFGGSTSDYFYSGIETSDGGIVAVGYSDSLNAGFTNKGGYDAMIIKCDSEGNQEWIKNFGGSDYDYFNSVIETSDGGIIAVGHSYSLNAGFSNNGYEDAVIVKYDSEGNQQWVKNFGGSGYECFYSAIETSDKGIVAVGYSDSVDTEFVNNGDINAVVVKYDSQGNQLWVKNYSGGIENNFNSVIETKYGDIIAVGKMANYSNDGLGTASISLIVKYDKDGNELWVKIFSKESNETFSSIKESVNDDFIIVGYSSQFDIQLMEDSFSPIFLYYNEDYEDIFEQINEVESSLSVENLNTVREAVNKIPEGIFKKYFQNRLNELNVSQGLERKITSANLDLYIKCENMLLMSLDTNSITFDDFSGVEDVVKANAVNITINSSLPYQLNAYLPIEIQNSDKSNTMDKRILNIKENSESDYKEFLNINEKVILKDNCPAGNDLTHGVDLKLVGGIAHEKDVYKTTIRFEAEQK